MSTDFVTDTHTARKHPLDPGTAQAHLTYANLPAPSQEHSYPCAISRKCPRSCSPIIRATCSTVTCPSAA